MHCGTLIPCPQNNSRLQCMLLQQWPFEVMGIGEEHNGSTPIGTIKAGKVYYTGYSALPSPPRLMRRTHTHTQRDSVAPIVTIPSLAKRQRR